MSFSDKVLKNEEKVMYSLRGLYNKYGYSLYKVSQFEEYDLYAHNKNFLVSQNILTFTDTNGKLLALKPDVTLSIIKNISDDESITHRFCYNENVYRTSTSSNGFREIMQTGLECIGYVDLYAECEVIMLAMRSLEIIDKDYILDISHMGIIEGLFDDMNMSSADRSEYIKLIESKNINSLINLCEYNGISKEMCKKLKILTELYLPIEKALPVIKRVVSGEKMTEAYKSLSNICNILSSYGLTDRLYVDFSIVNDVNYYDGISFKGFINGIPDSVLSGGRYDKLLERLGKCSGAIGFAVYMDRLERLENSDERMYDVDAVLLYDKNIDVKNIINAQKELEKHGKSVLSTSMVESSLRYRELFKIMNGGIKLIETND